jgi:hypothetical protein
MGIALSGSAWSMTYASAIAGPANKIKMGNVWKTDEQSMVSGLGQECANGWGAKYLSSRECETNSGIADFFHTAYLTYHQDGTTFYKLSCKDMCHFDNEGPPSDFEVKISCAYALNVYCTLYTAIDPDTCQKLTADSCSSHSEIDAGMEFAGCVVNQTFDCDTRTEQMPQDCFRKALWTCQ